MTYTCKPYVSRYPVQALRGLPLQPLRGLGEITPGEQAVIEGMDKILAVAHEQTQRVIEATGVFSKGAAREWARNIVDYVNTLRSRMIAVSKNGRLFFVDQPVVAQKLLDDCVKFLAASVQEFQASAATTTAVAAIEGAVRETAKKIVELGSTAARGAFDAAAGDPFGALLFGGAVIAGVLLYLKFKPL